MAKSPKDPKSKSPVRWWQVWRLFKPSKDEAFRMHEQKLDLETSRSQDWIASLDRLQPLVRSMRNEIDDLDIHNLSFDILGAGTFLLQIDLLLIKLRQHYNNYERRFKELNKSVNQIKDIMIKVEHHCKTCYQETQGLYEILRKKTYRDLNHKGVINQVHELETEIKSLTQCMHSLNEMALKRDPLYHLFETELFKTLMELEQGGREATPNEYNLGQANTTHLRDKAHHIVESDMRKIGFNLISFYETLRRCSILYQSPQVTKVLESFKSNVTLYLDVCCDEKAENDMKEACIHALFFDLEAMRFTRFKGFQDKAKTVKKQMKQILSQSEFGIQAMKTLSISPRAKLSLKSTFR